MSRCGVSVVGLMLLCATSSTLAADQLRLQDFQIEASHLPAHCRLQKAPGEHFFCPFDKTPYYSKEPGFVGCIQHLIGLDKTPPAKAVWLQAYQDTQSDAKSEVGVFAFEMQTVSDARAAQQKLQPDPESTDLEVVQSGPFLFWIWNDVERTSLCYQSVRHELQLFLDRMPPASGLPPDSESGLKQAK